MLIYKVIQFREQEYCGSRNDGKHEQKQTIVTTLLYSNIALN